MVVSDYVVRRVLHQVTHQSLELVSKIQWRSTTCVLGGEANALRYPIVAMCGYVILLCNPVARTQLRSLI